MEMKSPKFLMKDFYEVLRYFWRHNTEWCISITYSVIYMSFR